MSYGLTGYKLNSGDSIEDFNEVMHGEDEYEGRSLSESDIKIICNILTDNGFTLSPMTSSREYNFKTIQISLGQDYIGVSLPYWDDARDDIKPAMKVMTEIYKNIGIVFWDPQLDEVITDTEKPSTGFEHGLKLTNTIRDKHQTNEKPWWKFWQ